MATVCVNFVCKPANEALYYVKYYEALYCVKRELLFHLDLCIFGAWIL